MKKIAYLILFLALAACSPAQKAADDFLSQVANGQILLVEGLSITTWDVFDQSLIEHRLIEEGVKPTAELKNSFRDYYLNLPMSINSFELISSKKEEKYLWTSRDIGDPEKWKMFKQTEMEYIDNMSDLYKDRHNFTIDSIHQQIIFQDLVPVFTFEYKVTTARKNYNVVVKVVKTKDILSGETQYKVARISSVQI